MMTKAQPGRTDLGSEHPEPYRALAAVAKRADESAAARLSPGQMSAVSWVARVINSHNRIAISSAYQVNP